MLKDRLPVQPSKAYSSMQNTPPLAHASSSSAANNARTGYSQTPIMVYWEVTQACDLACVHCRADAAQRRSPLELSTDEGFHLLDAIAGFGDPEPHLVLTGGDPLKRPDIYTLAEHAVQAGLQTSITPSGTPLLTQEALQQLYATGIRTVALSLDGPDATRHDHIRQVPGSFERTIAAARWARATGFSLQINSLVCAQTALDLTEMYRRVQELDADRWSVFFLVNVGRGTRLSPVGAFQCEEILEWLYELTAKTARPIIKTTEAHHFRRIALQKQQQAALPGGLAGEIPGHADAPAAASATPPPGTNGHTGPPDRYASIRRGFGVRDGAGIMFISHTGEVYPAGFLPLSVGNVRRDSPVRLYRESALFKQLRDPSQLKGKCGRCDYRVVCGGARSRAWAATGDPLEADPLCPYRPRAAAEVV